MNRLMSLLVAGLLALAAAGAGGCTTNPATGQRQFNMLDQKQEISLGEQAEPQFLQQYGGEIPSREIHDYVSNLGERLAKVSERPDLPWEFHVVDSSVVNAFSIPGGKVFMSRGLLAKLDNEAQLAGVLGHEIGHVTAQHIGQQMTRAQGLSALGTALGVAAQTSNAAYLQVLGLGTQVGGGLYMLKFGRGQEDQADELGMRYMSRLNYNPVAQLQVMKVLKSLGGGGQPEILSTHPLPESRIKHIQGILKKDYPNARDSTRYTLNEEQFRQHVLDPLRTLPAPRNNGEQAAPTKGGSSGLRSTGRRR